MKFRTDFVTNSSSSSFIIAKSHLTEDQIDKIKNHSEIAREMSMSCWDHSWEISEDDYTISGYTWMDNFDMYDFFEKIKVTLSNVKWGE